MGKSIQRRTSFKDFSESKGGAAMKIGQNLNRKLTACGMVLIFIVLLLAAARPQPSFANDGTLYRYKVKVKSGYLALRRAKKYDSRNEIGKLYTGDKVIHLPSPTENSKYWYVYSPKHKKLGYVNRKYLKFYKEYTGKIDYYAKVKRGYLALRNAKKYDRSNETGRLYTGDWVIVLYKSSSDYWTVYSPDLEKAGYTNKHYLKRLY
jgi:hypothetical protein